MVNFKHACEQNCSSIPLTYKGPQLNREGELLFRYFNLVINEKVPTFVVKPGDDIKARMAEVQHRFYCERKDSL